MIPTIPEFTENLEEKEIPTNTFRIVYDKDRVNGTVDDIEAMKQAIYLILSTERYMYSIYPWDYGIEIIDLFGKPRTYVMATLKQRITEALLQDERIDSVTDFSFEFIRSKIHVTFVANTVYGRLDVEKEVAA